MQSTTGERVCGKQLPRQEIRAHMRGMNDDQRRQAMRTYEFRSAALEVNVPELSGLSQTQFQAATEESLRFRFADQMAALALGVAQSAHETVQLALENEIKATDATVEQGPPPKESKPWI
jgi:hypothetical protein